jgi:hypothetical protein
MMDLMLRIFIKMCAEILSTTNSTQNNKVKSTRLPKPEALESLDPGNG